MMKPITSASHPKFPSKGLWLLLLFAIFFNLTCCSAQFIVVQMSPIKLRRSHFCPLLGSGYLDNNALCTQAWEPIECFLPLKPSEPGSAARHVALGEKW